MSRPRRINVPFTLYHAMSRTNSGDIAFHDPKDHLKFLHYLQQYVILFDFRVHVFCLMGNHFHLLLESRRNASISELMRRLLTAYTVYYNRRYDRHGHLFQGRFKSLVVDKSNYLLPLSRYIHNNPVRLGQLSFPETYKWSSLHYYIKGNEPSFLYTGEILGWFQGQRKEYARFVREGLTEQTKPVIISQKFIGGEAFVKRWINRLKQWDMEEQKGKTLPSCVKSQGAGREEEKSRAALFLGLVAREYRFAPEALRQARVRQGAIGEARTILINLLRDYLPWTCQEIAEFMNLSHKTMIYHHQSKLRKNGDLRNKYEKIVHKHLKNR